MNTFEHEPTPTPRLSPAASARRPRRRTAALIAVAAVAGVLSTVGLSPSGVSAGTATTATGSVALSGTQEAPRHDEVQRSLDRVVRAGTFPAALAAVSDGAGRVRDYTAGVGNVRTGSAVPVDGQVRIGSNTKTFVAAVVLQLVGEGKVELDTSIETYLPGLVRGEEIHGRRITVRQLLQHTSGLPDYDHLVAVDLQRVRNTYYEPRELVDAGLSQPALFAPGTGWSYSNTNYVIAGLLVQKVTGRPIGEEITRRIIEPLGLESTYWPGVGRRNIREPHPRGYHHASPDEALADFTRFDPSMGWAPGQLISTPSDTLAFFTALLDGQVLRPQELREMKATVRAPDFDVDGAVRYGLGIAKSKLSCGDYAWGHGGDIPGYETRNAVIPDGRGAVIAVTALPSTMREATLVHDALDTVLCQ